MSPRPKQNEKRVSAYVSDELLNYLKDEAKNKNINVSTLVRIILSEHKNAQTKQKD